MKKVLLKSNLEPEKILERLNEVTEKFYTDSDRKFLFEGKISGSDFQLLPTFNYGSRNQLRPKIKGSVTKNGTDSFIGLEFKLPDSLLLLFSVTAVINSGIVIFLFLHPISEFFNWKFFMLFCIGTFLIFYLNYNSKVNASIKVLTKILNAEVI